MWTLTLKNDVSNRADLRILKPMLEQIIIKNNMALVNTEPTWFRPGKKRSLLDLVIMTHPQHSLSCKNVINILSEHSGVLLELNLALDVPRKQFITVRNSRNVNWDNLRPLIEDNDDLNSLSLG